MKKFLAVSLFLVILAAVVIPTLAYDWSYLIPNLPGGETSGGSDGGTLWIRKDTKCDRKSDDEPIREKTDCRAGGESQCTAQYCN